MCVDNIFKIHETSMTLMRDITFPKPFSYTFLQPSILIFTLTPYSKKGKAGTLLQELISISSHFYPCWLYISPADISILFKYTKDMLSSWPLHLLSSQQNILIIVSCLQSVQFSRNDHMCMVEGNTCCLFWDSPKAESELIIWVYSGGDLRNISQKVGK